MWRKIRKNSYSCLHQYRPQIKSQILRRDTNKESVVGIKQPSKSLRDNKKSTNLPSVIQSLLNTEYGWLSSQVSDTQAIQHHYEWPIDPLSMPSLQGMLGSGPRGYVLSKYLMNVLASRKSKHHRSDSIVENSSDEGKCN